MKKGIFTLLIIFLAITSNLGLITAQNETELMNTTEEEVESKCFSEDEIKQNIENETGRIGENVKTPTGGSRNVTFNDGYNGYCINKGWSGAEKGDDFKVQDTSIVKHNHDKEDVSNYLKILFTYHHDFAVADKDETANIVWTFSDWDYKTTTNPIVKSILSIAESGVIIPDHGFVKQINETTEALFNFEVLKATQAKHQSFFGYKITYRTIPVMEDITNNTPSNETINITEDNKTDNATELNESVNNISSVSLPSKENITVKADYEKPTENESVSEFENENVSLKKHVTGYNFIPALIILLFGTLLLVKYSRD